VESVQIAAIIDLEILLDGLDQQGHDLPVNKRKDQGDIEYRYGKPGPEWTRPDTITGVPGSGSAGCNHFLPHVHSPELW